MWKHLNVSLDVSNDGTIVPCEATQRMTNSIRTQLRSIDLRYIDFLGIKYNQQLGFGTRLVYTVNNGRALPYFVW